MVRCLLLIALLACLVWQSFASAHASVAPQGDGDLGHALLHWSGEAHHHHDGGIHQDDSDESVAHVMTDHMGGAAALLTSTETLGVTAAREALPITSQAQLPPPFLDGLLRPPRA